MATKSAIEWTDGTANFWVGCSRVSPGCKNCYAFKDLKNKKALVRWGFDWKPKGRRHRTGKSTWALFDRAHRKAEKTGVSKILFASSWADFFEDNAALVLIRQDAWSVIKRTTKVWWMILTKRPENIAGMLPADWGAGYSNVCLMVTAENQDCLDRRLPELLKVPAKYRALSVEPLLGPIVFKPAELEKLDLVIVGGESGNKKVHVRPMNPNWVRSIRDQCKACPNVRFNFKQWGGWAPDKKLAAKNFSNAAVFLESTPDVPIIVRKIKALAERKSLLARVDTEVVFRATSKEAAGDQLDGVTCHEHIFRSTSAPAATPVVRTIAPAVAPLTSAEQSEFENLDRIVRKGLMTFREVGLALKIIRDRRLYRARYATFKLYCEKKLDSSRADAHRQIQAAGVVEVLATAPVKFSKLPTNVGQARELARLKTPEEIRRIWALVSAGKNPSLTAKIIRRAVTESLTPTTAPRKTKKIAIPVEFPAKEVMDICDQMRVTLKEKDLRKLSIQINMLHEIAKSHHASLISI